MSATLYHDFFKKLNFKEKTLNSIVKNVLINYLLIIIFEKYFLNKRDLDNIEI